MCQILRPSARHPPLSARLPQPHPDAHTAPHELHEHEVRERERSSQIMSFTDVLN